MPANIPGYWDGYMGKFAADPAAPAQTVDRDTLLKWMQGLPAGTVDPTAGQKTFEEMVGSAPLKISLKGAEVDPAYAQKKRDEYTADPRPLVNMLAWWSAQKKSPYGMTQPKRSQAFGQIPAMLMDPVLDTVRQDPRYLDQVREKFYTTPPTANTPARIPEAPQTQVKLAPKASLSGR